jgi:hypothetical protein
MTLDILLSHGTHRRMMENTEEGPVVPVADDRIIQKIPFAFAELLHQKS